MIIRFARICVTLSAIAPAACGATDFVRPDPAELRVGQGTYSQVVATMGAPSSTREVLSNGEKIKTITYVSNTGGEPLEAGVIPTRVIAFYFHQDHLVGQEFVSSFKADHTNFDDAKVAGFEKGKTTRSEILQALGKPTANYVKPMVKETSTDAIGYGYTTTSGSALTGLRVSTKLLSVAFDRNDKALEISYSAYGKAPPAQESYAKTFPTRADKATVYVYRADFPGKIFSIPVSVNNTPIGRMFGYGFYALELPAGTYTFKTRADKDAEMTLEVQAGKNYYVWLSMSFGMRMGNPQFKIVDEKDAKSTIFNECSMVTTSAFPNVGP